MVEDLWQFKVIQQNFLQNIGLRIQKKCFQLHPQPFGLCLLQTQVSNIIFYYKKKREKKGFKCHF